MIKKNNQYNLVLSMGKRRFRSNIMVLVLLGVVAIIIAGFSTPNVPVGIPSLNITTLVMGLTLLLIAAILYLLGRKNQSTI